MQYRLTIFIALFALVGGAIWQYWPIFYSITVEVQRQFQNAMASGLRAAQNGDPGAILALCTATFSYGLVHAAGPGHGKILLGSTALASATKMRKMIALSVLSALAQSVTAILIVSFFVGGWNLLTSRDAVDLAETWLRPLSYILFIVIGCVLIWRGARMIMSYIKAASQEAETCNHSHGPSADQVASLLTWKDSLALVVSIAIRPCTGALFLLIISAQLNLLWLGIIGTLAMGLGTAAFNASIAASGVLARTLVESGHNTTVRLSGGTLQVIGGVLIIVISLAFLAPSF